jgi:hypothetical protein
MLYYKANGGEQYQVITMAKSSAAGGTTNWTATIPGSDTKARLVPYYIEARNQRGASVALSGREESPSLIVVKGADTPAAAPTANVDGDNPDEEEAETEEIDDNNPLARLERERRKEQHGSRGTWWLSFGIGSGIGYAAGRATEAFGSQGVSFTPGIAFAALGQAVPEIGYFIGRNTALSVAGRLQYIGNGPNGIATGALTALLRLSFYSEDGEKVRWYFAPTAGVGEGFRFQVDATVIDKEGRPTQVVKDTVRGGPFVAGAGTGMLYRLSRHWRWTLDTQFLVGVPKVSAVLDLTTGGRWEF